MNTQPHRSNLSHLFSKSDAIDTSRAKVAILLCTFNGSRFLGEQLDSFVRQTHKNWVVYASDDGSSDETLLLLKDFQKTQGKDRMVLLNGPNQGFAKNFLSLIKNRSIIADYFAFSDQDDIWFDDKLERGLAKVGKVQNVPALYCSRTRLISADKRLEGYSPLFTAAPAFANALVQSIAGANTMLINSEARELLAHTPDDAEIVAHDWLTYLLVTGCGGTVFYDPLPTLDYRQHSDNIIGANNRWRDRVVRLGKMCTGRFRQWSSQNLLILKGFSEKLTPQSQQTMARFEQARDSALIRRIFLMKKSGVYRQTSPGNISLFIATCLNWI